MAQRHLVLGVLLALALAACDKSPASYERGVPDESLAHARPGAPGAITPPSSGMSNGTGHAVPGASAS